MSLKRVDFPFFSGIYARLTKLTNYLTTELTTYRNFKTYYFLNIKY